MDNATRLELTARNAVQMQQNQLNTLAQSKKTKEAALKLAQAELERKNRARHSAVSGSQSGRSGKRHLSED